MIFLQHLDLWAECLVICSSENSLLFRCADVGGRLINGLVGGRDGRTGSRKLVMHFTNAMRNDLRGGEQLREGVARLPLIWPAYLYS